MFIVAVLLLIKQIIKPTTGIELPITLIVIILFYIPSYIGGLWRTYHASYCYGEITEGFIQNISAACASVVRLDVINSKTNEKHRVRMVIPIRFSNPYYLPKIGQRVTCYLVKNDRRYIHLNPKIYAYMLKHCLQ